MAFHRVVDHLKRQNWTAVALDLAIVVLGVFIGLQVDGWNQARKDRGDAQTYLVRIHSDLQRAEMMSRRTRQRRIGLIHGLESAAAALLMPGATRALTTDECYAIGTSNFQNVNVTGLPALEELMSTARVTILNDDALSTALIQYRQAADNLAQIIYFQVSPTNDLSSKYPAMIRTRAYWDDRLGEIQSRYTCDTAAMRRNSAYLNDFSHNVDTYDAYLRDGVRPWSEQLTRVHAMIDRRLGLQH